MAATWPNFALVSGTDYPERSIRDGYETTWETQRNPEDAESEQERRVEVVGIKVACNKRSTVMADFSTFRKQQTMTNPVMFVSDADGESSVQYTGVWRIQRIRVDDGEGSTCWVRVTIHKASAWMTAATTS